MLLRIDDIVSGLAKPNRNADGNRKAEDSEEEEPGAFGDARDG